MSASPADPRAERVAHNERFFRDVNERIDAARGAAMADPSVVCECASLECSQQLDVPRKVYREVRSDPTTFLIAPGHEAPGVEQVERSTGAYAIVRKVGVSAEIVSGSTVEAQSAGG